MTDNPTWTHADHMITIDDGMLKLFVVTGPHVVGAFPSYREAVTKIDDAIHKYELTTRKRVQIPVLTERGERATITGIHASTGAVLGLPKSDYGFGDSLYPDVAWIADTLKQMRDLMKQVDDLRKKLIPFIVEQYEIRGSRMIDHGTRVDNLVTVIEEKRVAAEEDWRIRRYEEAAEMRYTLTMALISEAYNILSIARRYGGYRVVEIRSFDKLYEPRLRVTDDVTTWCMNEPYVPDWRIHRGEG